MLDKIHEGYRLASDPVDRYHLYDTWFRCECLYLDYDENIDINQDWKSVSEEQDREEAIGRMIPLILEKCKKCKYVIND